MPTLVGLDLQPEMGHGACRDRPELALEACARRAEGELLPYESFIGPSPIGRGRHRELLGAADCWLLHLDPDPSNGLRAIEHEGHRLFTGCAGDPPASTRTSVRIERIVN